LRLDFWTSFSTVAFTGPALVSAMYSTSRPIFDKSFKKPFYSVVDPPAACKVFVVIVRWQPKYLLVKQAVVFVVSQQDKHLTGFWQNYRSDFQVVPTEPWQPHRNVSLQFVALFL
jgi:hypothetical protein